MERKIIDYIVVCINEFALSKNLTEQEAFRYLYANKGICKTPGRTAASNTGNI